MQNIWAMFVKFSYYQSPLRDAITVPPETLDREPKENINALTFTSKPGSGPLQNLPFLAIATASNIV